MEQEKIKEIKKALQDHSIEKLKYQDGIKIKEIGFIDIVTYINELESENERLEAEKQKVLEYMKTDNYAKLKKEDMYWGYQMGIGMLENEIDRQKDRIAELEKELTNDMVFYKDGICYPMNCQGALKQFAERLKKKNCSIPMSKDFIIIQTNTIDETLKEFIND